MPLELWGELSAEYCCKLARSLGKSLGPSNVTWEDFDDLMASTLGCYL